MKEKVFCIGFHKTGTTSMMRILQGLGYRVTGPNNVKKRDIGARLEEMTAALSHQYDAFQDNPWPLVYRQMDALHPGAKFILTVRDEKGWFDSFRNHVEGKQLSPTMQLIYGTDALPSDANAELFRGRMRAHNQEVRDYFKDRPDDLLVLDISRNAGWGPICAFLGRPVPAAPLPHANHRKYAFLPEKARALLKKGWISGRRLSRRAFGRA